MNHRHGEVSGGETPGILALGAAGEEESEGENPGWSAGRDSRLKELHHRWVELPLTASLPSSVGCRGPRYSGFLVSMGSCPDRWGYPLRFRKLRNSREPVLDLG